MRRWRLLIPCCITLSSVGFAQDISVTAATSYLTGRHGAAEPTTAWVSFAMLQTSYSDFQLAVTLPHLSVKSGAEITEVGGILLARGGGRVSGFGDLLLQVERALPLGERAPVAVTASAFAKVPTGASNISTGEYDGGVDVEISKSIGKVSPFLKAGYRFYGDSRELELQNGWAGSAGATARVGKVILLGSTTGSNPRSAGRRRRNFTA